MGVQLHGHDAAQLDDASGVLAGGQLLTDVGQIDPGRYLFASVQRLLKESIPVRPAGRAGLGQLFVDFGAEGVFVAAQRRTGLYQFLADVVRAGRVVQVAMDQRVDEADASVAASQNQVAEQHRLQ